MIASQPSPVHDSHPEQGTPHLTPLAVPSSQLCIANISTRERRKRLLGGAIELVIGLGIWAALLAFGVNRWWRLALLPVFWGAIEGYFQWRDRT